MLRSLFCQQTTNLKTDLQYFKQTAEQFQKQYVTISHFILKLQPGWFYLVSFRKECPPCDARRCPNSAAGGITDKREVRGFP